MRVVPRPQSSLTKYILSLPSDLSASEVIAKAKARGYETSASNVARVRAHKIKPAKAATKADKPEAKPAVATPAPSKSTTKLSKSEFIRQQPATLGPAAVVAKAKAVGLAFDDKYVSKIRSLANGKGRPAKKSKAAAKAPTPQGAQNLSAFIRSQPSSLTAAQLVAKAKAQGMTLRPGLVYEVRRTSRAGKRATSHAVAPAPRNATTTVPSSRPATAEVASRRSGTNTVDDLLRAAAAELGLARAIEILRGERARVQAVIGG